MPSVYANMTYNKSGNKCVPLYFQILESGYILESHILALNVRFNLTCLESNIIAGLLKDLLSFLFSFKKHCLPYTRFHK